jgi:hypothetical protein
VLGNGRGARAEVAAQIRGEELPEGCGQLALNGLVVRNQQLLRDTWLSCRRSFGLVRQ